jgi:hypothetical protein
MRAYLRNRQRLRVGEDLLGKAQDCEKALLNRIERFSEEPSSSRSQNNDRGKLGGHHEGRRTRGRAFIPPDHG